MSRKARHRPIATLGLAALLAALSFAETSRTIDDFSPRFGTARSTNPDCNSNGILDDLELLAGSATDCNGNLIPDTCDLASPPEQFLTYPEHSLGAWFGFNASFSHDVAGIFTRTHQAVAMQWDGIRWNARDSVQPEPSNSCKLFGIAIDGPVLATAYAIDLGAARPNCTNYETVVRRYDGAVWHEEARLPHPYNTGAHLGRHLALQGDRLFTLISYDPLGVGVTDGAIVYRYNGSTWLQEDHISIIDHDVDSSPTIVDMVVDDEFVVFSSVIGIPPTACGPIYVMRRNAAKHGGTHWLQEGRLELPDTTCLGLIHVAIEDGVLVVASTENLPSDVIHVFRRHRVVGAGAATWDEEAVLPGHGPVAIAKGMIAAIAPVDSQPDPDHVSVLLYRYHPGSVPPWTLERTIRTPLERAESLAFDASALLVGDPFDGTVATSAGAVYAYQLAYDCNSNGVPDSCDIDAGDETDCNANGIPDACESPCEALGIGIEDGPRLAELFDACQTDVCPLGICDPPLYAGDCCTLFDADADGDVDLADYAVQQRCTRSAVVLDCNDNTVGDHLETVLADFDGDGLTTPADFDALHHCLSPTCTTAPCDPVIYGDPCCLIADADHDGDIDLIDFATFQIAASAE